MQCQQQRMEPLMLMFKLIKNLPNFWTGLRAIFKSTLKVIKAKLSLLWNLLFGYLFSYQERKIQILLKNLILKPHYGEVL